MRERFDRLDLDLLRVLVAIDRCRSVTDAGRMLSLSQPAASNALARLREAFDDPLYVRVAGGLTPTPLAERIAPAAARQLEALEQVLTEPAVFDPARSNAEWRLSLSDLGEIVFLSRIAAAVLEHGPNTRLTNAAVPAARAPVSQRHRWRWRRRRPLFTRVSSRAWCGTNSATGSRSGRATMRRFPIWCALRRWWRSFPRCLPEWPASGSRWRCGRCR